MKKQFLTLMLGASIFTTTPLFAMDSNQEVEQMISTVRQLVKENQPLSVIREEANKILLSLPAHHPNREEFEAFAHAFEPFNHITSPTTPEGVVFYSAATIREMNKTNTPTQHIETVIKRGLYFKTQESPYSAALEKQLKEITNTPQ